MPTQRKFPVALMGVLAVLLAVGVTSCGGDDEVGASRAGDARTAEKAFLAGMTHHHGTAIEMAKIAQKRGQSPFVTGLAHDIVSAQKRELREMREIYRRLIGGTLKPDPGAHDGLGLSAEEAGMTHTPKMSEGLREADPFDRAFVDEMAPHHVGAVKMAEVVLESTEDEQLRKLAGAIISAQEREIEEMNDFRIERYGSRVPEAGGDELESDDSMEGMDH